MVTRPKTEIVVVHVRPPIPTKQFDYCAYHDGEEETQHYGWGPTKEAAIEDLKNWYDDEEETNGG